MGDAQSIPVVGETVTVVESGTKMVAASGCAVLGAVQEVSTLTVNAAVNYVSDGKINMPRSPNPFFDKAENLARGAGNSLKEYSEKNVIAASIKASIKESDGDIEEAIRIRKIRDSSLEGFVDSAPVVGHAKGVYHFLDGDTEHGKRCMLNATRGAAVLGAGALTGGLGTVPAGLTVVGSGLAYDATVSITDAVINKEESKPYGSVAAFVKIVEDEDPNDIVDFGLALTGDFVAGALSSQNESNFNPSPKSNLQILKKADLTVKPLQSAYVQKCEKPTCNDDDLIFHEYKCNRQSQTPSFPQQMSETHRNNSCRSTKGDTSSRSCSGSRNRGAANGDDERDPWGNNNNQTCEDGSFEDEVLEGWTTKAKGHGRVYYLYKGYWYSPDTAGHAGSVFKKYNGQGGSDERPNTLVFIGAVDKTGRVIEAKHESNTNAHHKGNIKCSDMCHWKDRKVFLTCNCSH